MVRGSVVDWGKRGGLVPECQNPHSLLATDRELGGTLTCGATLIDEEKSGRSQFYAARDGDESALQMAA